MITHNGTYLLHATHHGMPIVAATMGGKMMIGGKWLLSATQQAIVAAFGAEGTEVIAKTNDYLNRIATTDPQRALLLANFINEDPMLVCSLVETSKVRSVLGNNSGYFDTNIKVTGHNVDFMFRTQKYPTNSDCAVHLTARNSWATDIYGLFTRSGAKQITYHGSEQVFMPFNEFNIYNFVTNVENSSGTVTNLTTGDTKTHTLDLVPSADDGLKVLGFKDLTRCSTVGCIHLIIDNGSTAHFIPYRDPSTGEMELLDILTGNLATRVGTFTEQLTSKTTETTS